MPLKNKINVRLTVNEIGYKKFMQVPTFKNLLHDNQRKELKVGENDLTVSHTSWGTLNRMCGCDSNNMKIEKIINHTIKQ